MAQPVPFHTPNPQNRRRPQQHLQPVPNHVVNPPWNPNSVRMQAGNPHPAVGSSTRPIPPPAPAQYFPQNTQYYTPHTTQPSQAATFGSIQPSMDTEPSAYPIPQPPQQFRPTNLNNDPDFFQQISGNPMAGIAMHTASDFIQKQSQMYFPGAFGVYASVKYYFTVNNNYVKHRFRMLMFPFWHKSWRRHTYTEGNDHGKTAYAPPTRDINAPDLYIPLMGFLTYILIVGYTKGASNQFSPDVIGADASYCLVMQLMEVGVLAMCLYLLQSSLSFLDLVSFSGYKYVSLVINAICYQLLGSIAYYAALAYTGVAVSYFTLNCMKGSVLEPTPEKRSLRNYVLFGMSCLQLILVCFISYTTAPHE